MLRPDDEKNLGSAERAAKLYAAAMVKWGVAKQILKAGEEGAELARAAIKTAMIADDWMDDNESDSLKMMEPFFRELMDCEILIEQMRCYFGSKRFQVLKEEALDKLERHLQVTP